MTRRPSRLQRRSRPNESPTSFSRFFGRGWFERLATESPAVLVHAGFGIQLLSMRLGEAGLGLSQGVLHRTPINLAGGVSARKAEMCCLSCLTRVQFSRPDSSGKG